MRNKKMKRKDLIEKSRHWLCNYREAGEGREHPNGNFRKICKEFKCQLNDIIQIIN